MFTNDKRQVLITERRNGSNARGAGPERSYYGISGGSLSSCAPRLIPGAGTIRLYVEGDDLYEAMLASVAAARHEVWLESYILADDAIGRRFVEALAERARAGVDVRLHLDAAGSLFWASARIVRELPRHGVRLRWFHRWSWRDPFRYNRRNHRKLLVIDGTVAYVGGFNIHAESSRKLFGEQRWRDTHVRLDGALARQAAALFDAFWSGDRGWTSVTGDGVANLLLPNTSRRCRTILHCLYDQAFGEAGREAFIATPYFVPDRKLQHRLVNAAGRGVDVRLLVPLKSDVRLARWAGRAAYQFLLRGGVRIFEYLPRMLHAKTVVTDGAWAVVGTANFDYRSLFLNYELTLVSRDTVLCANLRQQFLDDLAESREVRLIPGTPPWPEQVANTLGWLARRWL
jgi:cardiolipin synthase